MSKRRSNRRRTRRRNLEVRSDVFRAAVPRPRVRPPNWEVGPLTDAQRVSLSLLVLTLTLLLVLLVGDAFYIADAQVIGAHIVPAEAILSATHLQGRNVFFIRPQEVREALMELPYILDADVRLALPGRVIIRVREREPVATWQVGTARFAVDAEGVILPTRPPATGPVIVAEVGVTDGSIDQSSSDSASRSDAPQERAGGTRPQFGERVDARGVAVARALWALLPTARSLVYSESLGVGVRTEAGWTAYFGFEEDHLAEKVKLVQRLEREGPLRPEEIAYVDLRYLRRPYVKLVGKP